MFKVAASQVGPVQINASEAAELQGFNLLEQALFLSALA